MFSIIVLIYVYGNTKFQYSVFSIPTVKIIDKLRILLQIKYNEYWKSTKIKISSTRQEQIAIVYKHKFHPILQHFLIVFFELILTEITF